MKKIIWLAFAFLLIAAAAPVLADEAAESSSSSAIEKISSPDQIKFFKVIKNENGTLFGVRLNSKASSSVALPLVSSTASNTKGLEKILAPNLAGLYEKIQKIGNSLWGVRKKQAVQENTGFVAVSSEMLACVGAAIDKKDAAVSEIAAKSASSLQAAIGERGTCQKKAIASLDGQQEALQACLASFKKAHQEIMQSAKEAQQAAWKEYRLALQSCSSAAGSALTIEDGGASSFEVLTQ